MCGHLALDASRCQEKVASDASPHYGACMTLQEFLDDEDMSLTAFARAIGVSDSTVKRWCDGAIPKSEVMLDIYHYSCGRVEPVDWYPAIAKQLRGGK